MKGSLGRWTDEQTDRDIVRQMDGQTMVDGQTDRWKDRQTNRSKDEQLKRWIDIYMNIQMDGVKYRQTDRSLDE